MDVPKLSPLVLYHSLYGYNVQEAVFYGYPNISWSSEQYTKPPPVTLSARREAWKTKSRNHAGVHSSTVAITSQEAVAWTPLWGSSQNLRRFPAKIRPGVGRRGMDVGPHCREPLVSFSIASHGHIDYRLWKHMVPEESEHFVLN